jgi:predicted transcriptional regulator
MSQQVTLELPDEVLHRAERLATLVHRDVREILAEAVTVVLPPIDVVLEESCSVSELSNGELLKLAELRLAPAQDRRLSQLLDAQQAGTLLEQERTELLTLIQIYEVNLLRQAEALAEAVRRGLREPLSP